MALQLRPGGTRRILAWHHAHRRSGLIPTSPLTWNTMAFNESAFSATWTPKALALLRIVSGYLFLLHGSAKLLGYPHVAMFDKLQVMSLPGIAGVIELVGGVLLVLGLFTRPAAFVMSGTMAFAYFIGHASKGNPLFPLLNGGEAAVLFCFVFLFISAAGPGAWSLGRHRSA
jgi:putative oxidoreductase